MPAEPLVPLSTHDASSPISQISDAPLPGGIRVDLRGEHCQLPHDTMAIQATISRIASVLAVYPEQFLATAETREISVCTGLHTERGPMWGLAYPGQHRFLISIEADLQAVHHELFHMIDRNTLLPKVPDPDDSMWIEWALVNPDGFHYGDHATRPAGFVSVYAASDDEEDRASTFGALMTAADDLCELARGDDVLRAKVRLIWRHAAALAGTDEFLRHAAPCVDWVD